MLTKNYYFYGVLAIIAGTAIAINSWIAAVIFILVLTAGVVLDFFERLHPIAKPDATGAELLIALEKHRTETLEMVNSLKSKMNMPISGMGRRE